MQVGRTRVYRRSRERMREQLAAGRSHGHSWAAAVCALLLLASCDVPTKPPKVQNRVLLPVASSAVAVQELLPPSVQLAGTSFRVQLAPATLATRSVAEMCGASCLALPDQPVPKPAFTDSSAVSLSLASDVVGATLSDGAIEVALTHGLEFDPVRPAGAEQNGWIRVSARSGGRVLGTLLIEDPFPPGATLRRTLPVQPGDVDGTVVVSVVLHSPAGAPVPAEWLRSEAAALTGTVTPLQLDAAEARVLVHEKGITVEQPGVDLSGIDAGLIRRVRGGAARITIDNPFAVTGAFELRLQRTGVDVRRTVQLGPNRQTTRIELSDAELHVLLGHALTLTLSGVVSAHNGEVVVRPGQEIGITTSFELVLEIG
jgi:hypothetical protein